MLTDQPTGAIVRYSALLAMVMCAGCQSAPRDRGSLLWDRVKQVAGRSHTRHAAGRQRVAKNITAQPSPRLTERNFAEVQLALGRSLEQDGNLRGAEDAYRAAVRNDKGNAVAHHRLALLAERQGNSGEARELLHRAAKLAPHNAEVQCDLGYWYALRERWAEAERHYRRAVEINPRFDRAHNNWGLMLVRSGKPQAAMDHFAAAGLTEAEARNNLGLGYVIRQEWHRADQQLQLALRSEPGLSQAAALATRVRVRMQASQNQVATEQRTRQHAETPQLAATTRKARPRRGSSRADLAAKNERRLASLAGHESQGEPLPASSRRSAAIAHPVETKHQLADSMDVGVLMTDHRTEPAGHLETKDEFIVQATAWVEDQPVSREFVNIPAAQNAMD